MAHSPLPWPERGALPDAILPPLNSPPSGKIQAPPDADLILSGLQQLITTGTRELDLILGEIAEAAQSLTGSSGAAIATRKGGVVICQGRSGHTAPALGTRLNVDSGISGECLRTGEALRCDDTSKDYRADQEACRQLGLRSVAAVPLRQGGKAAGILEAFSSRPHAFTKEHIDLLARLAQIAEAAAFQSAREVENAPEPPRQAELASSEALIQLRDKIAARPVPGAPDEHRQRYRLAVVALAIMLLVLAVGWKMRRNSASGIALSQQQSTLATTAQPTTQPIIQVEGLDALGAAPARKPSLAHSRGESRTGSALRVVQRTADKETANVASRHDSVPDLGDQPFTSASRLPTASAELVSLLSATPTLPKFAARVSQGISGGVLIRKVRPIYPPQALTLRLEGSVLLQATVTEKGAVRDLKVNSGNPLLVRAAIEAVSQWRYRPFLLDGNPVEKPVDISVDFKLPQ